MIAKAGLSQGGKWFGAAVKRKEDAALLTGRGRFVDDIELGGMLHAAFTRSPYAHAAIRSIDASAAKALPQFLHTSPRSARRATPRRAR